MALQLLALGVTDLQVRLAEPKCWAQAQALTTLLQVCVAQFWHRPAHLQCLVLHSMVQVPACVLVRVLDQLLALRCHCYT